jgi:transposase
MNLTEYKAAYAGKFVEFVNPAGTSQTCICGFSFPKKLSERIHRCPNCGLVMGRDQVSANVIEIRPSICTVGTTGISVLLILSVNISSIALRLRPQTPTDAPPLAGV